MSPQVDEYEELVLSQAREASSPSEDQHQDRHVDQKEDQKEDRGEDQNKENNGDHKTDRKLSGTKDQAARDDGETIFTITLWRRCI